MRAIRYDAPSIGRARGEWRVAGADGREAAGGRTTSTDGAAPASEAELLARVARGDSQAFRMLSRSHMAALLALAIRMLRNDRDAEDIVQEALLRLWSHAPSLTVGEAGVRPWLRRVVSNLCLDHIRRHRLQTVMAEPPEVVDPARQDRDLAERDLGRRVEAELMRLPERQRLALTLFHYEGLSQTEVGDMLSISEEAVESLLARARRSLKAALKDEWRQLLPGSE